MVTPDPHMDVQASAEGPLSHFLCANVEPVRMQMIARVREDWSCPDGADALV